MIEIHTPWSMPDESGRAAPGGLVLGVARAPVQEPGAVLQLRNVERNRPLPLRQDRPELAVVENAVRPHQGVLLEVEQPTHRRLRSIRSRRALRRVVEEVAVHVRQLPEH